MFDLSDDDVHALAQRIEQGRGRVFALDVPADRFQPLVDELEIVTDAEVRLVLGAACTTAARAVEHFIAALQLPYDAGRGWQDFLESLGERAASLRQTVVVADAAELLRHEDQERWHELVAELRGGPHCLGGGWTSLVLADHPWGWERSRLRSAAAAQLAADHGRARSIVDGMDDPYQLSRFVTAQDGVYEQAVAELRRGRKTSHWIWFIFPQIEGLGLSAASQRYAIGSLPEARAYLQHPVLGRRLVECAELLLADTEHTAEQILGEIDAMKVRSSMTLFSRAEPQERVFERVLARFFDGAADAQTLRRL